MSQPAETPPANAGRLLLFDGMALVYRAHFAFIKAPRLTATGLNTSPIFGFLNALLELQGRFNPTHLAVAFDTPEPTARHLAFPAYKAQRDAMPEDLSHALPPLFRLLAALRIPVLRLPGYEADDVIGTLARQAESAGYDTWMVTPDKDFAQLVAPHTRIFKPGRGQEPGQELGVAEILANWEIQRIEQVVDILGLMGDASDNVPGIPGVGEKTARKLIAQFGSVEGLLSRSNELTGKLRELVPTHAAQARLSRELVTINCAVPLPLTLAELRRQEPDREQLVPILRELEFRSFAKRLLGSDGEALLGATPPKPAPAPQISPDDLFAPPAATPATANPPAASDGTAESDAPFTLSADDPPATSESNASEAAPAADQPPSEPLARLADVPHDYRLVQTDAELDAMLTELAGVTVYCFDTETTSLVARLADCVGVAFSWAKGRGAFVALAPDFAGAQARLARLQPLFARTDQEKVGHNLKYDLAVLARYGLRVAPPLFDTMLAHALAEPEMRHGMDYLSQVYLKYLPIPISALIGEEGREPQKTMAQVPLPQVCDYAVEDADVTLQLRAVMHELLARTETTRVYWEVEAPLLPVLVAMEAEGIRVDGAALKTLSTQLADELQTLESAIYTHAGLPFNIDSPKQLGEILFERLQLNAGDKAKRTGKTGQYATGEQVLELLRGRHPIIGAVLDYRELRKLKGTYVDALPASMDPLTGRIHTHFAQAATATGRLASANPNLQNIPIRGERGREIRRAFVPRDADYLIYSADYSQIELRIIAHYSQDPGLMTAFEQDLDIHQATAARIFGVKLPEVTSEMRRQAKMVNFGIPYGISAFGLAQRLNIPRTQAAEIIASYFTQFPGVKGWIDELLEKAREQGFVQTLLGRRRYLRDLTSRNGTMRAQAERNAINTPIQGSAADMIKLAMIKVHEVLSASGIRTKLLLQVHDELVFDLHQDEADTLPPRLLDAMRTALPLRVPIRVDAGRGPDWLSAH